MLCVYIANTPSQTVVYHDMVLWDIHGAQCGSVTALADVSVDVWAKL